MSVGIVPNQQKFIDAYADHRFSNVIGRQLRSVVGDVKNTILPYSEDNFNISIDSSSQSVTISPGFCIMSDTLIHIKESSILDFTNESNYIGEYSTFGADIHEDMSGQTNYLILCNFIYQRTLPKPQLSFVIAKDRREFLENLETYLYLGSAYVVDDGSGPYIFDVFYEDTNELDSSSPITRNEYEYHPPRISGGCIDSTEAPNLDNSAIFAELTVE